MRKFVLRGLAVALVLSLTLHLWGQGQGSAKAIIEKGILAQGGVRNLAKTMTVRMQAKGDVFIGSEQLPFTIDMYVQLPDKNRKLLKINYQGKEVNLLQVVNGDKGWGQGDGPAMDTAADSLAHEKFGLYAARVQTLVPLVKEKGFSLANLGESKVNDKQPLGAKVASPGQQDISLYFDKASGLLVKVTRPGVDPVNKKAVIQDEYYSDYKEKDGVRQPWKLLINQDGKKILEATVTDYTYPATLPEKMFIKPE